MANEIANQFTGLPIADLIGGPLVAAADAQVALAQSTASFINEVGFNKGSGGNTGSMRMMDFKHTQLVDGEEKDITFSVPMLSVVKIPSLSIKTVDIQFDMEVKTSEKNETEKKKDGSLEGGAGWGPFKVAIKGSVSSSEKNTRTTDTSAKYQIKLHAADEGMPEGLSRVLDILSASIIPRDVKKEEELNPEKHAANLVKHAEDLHSKNDTENFTLAKVKAEAAIEKVSNAEQKEALTTRLNSL